MSRSEATTFSMIIGQLIADEVQSRGMTMKAFFEETGLSQPTWSRMMRGQSKMVVEDLWSACRFLELNMGELINRADMVAKALPKQDIRILEPQGNLGTIILASAALGFLITRLLK